MDENVRKLDVTQSLAERRNFALGVWAGRILGRQGDDLALYAGEIMASDLEEAGPQDVIARVCRDLQAHGVNISANGVRARMLMAERDVRRKLALFPDRAATH